MKIHLLFTYIFMTRKIIVALYNRRCAKNSVDTFLHTYLAVGYCLSFLSGMHFTPTKIENFHTLIVKSSKRYMCEKSVFPRSLWSWQLGPKESVDVCCKWVLAIFSYNYRILLFVKSLWLVRANCGRIGLFPVRTGSPTKLLEEEQVHEKYV